MADKQHTPWTVPADKWVHVDDLDAPQPEPSAQATCVCGCGWTFDFASGRVYCRKCDSAATAAGEK